MAVYWLMTALTGTFCLALHRTQEPLILKTGHGRITFRTHTALLFLTFLPMTAVSALRRNVGVDTAAYQWIFRVINDGTEQTHVEWGYALLNRLVGLFTDDPAWLFALCTGITLTFFALGFRTLPDAAPLGSFLFLTLGYFFYSMNSIRHFMALSVYFYAGQYLRARRFFPFLCWTLAAAAFHKVALFGLLLYAVLPRRYNLRQYALFAGAFLGAAVCHKPLLALIFRFVYQSYQGSVYQVYTLSPFNLVLCGLGCFFAFFYYRPLLEKDPQNILFINGAIFSLLFYLTCFWIPTPTRLGHYGTVLLLPLFPRALACEENPVHRRWLLTLLLVFALGFLGVMLSRAGDPTLALTPYQSLLSPERRVL